MSTTAPGSRNDRLNVAAFRCGQLVGGGELDRTEAKNALGGAARACGLGDAEARATIRSGLDAGQLEPRQREPRETAAVGTSERAPDSSATHEADEAPEWVPFPLHALPPVVASNCEAASVATGIDAATVAVPALGVLGGCVGTSRSVELKAGWCEPGIVWACLSQSTGEGKSPALDAVLGHLRDRQTREHLQYRAAVETTEAFSGHNDDADFPPEPAPVETTPPEPTPMLSVDATIEALLALLARAPRGLLLENDELSCWFGSHDRYKAGGRGGADRAMWLSAFGGRPVTIDRKSTGRTMVPAAALSLVGGIQPETLRETVTKLDESSGLLARLLIAEPPTPLIEWTEETVDADVDRAWRAVLDHLLAMQPESTSEIPKPGRVALSPDAKARWIAFFNRSHRTKRGAMDSREHARWSKWVGYGARLALVFELVERAGEPAADHQSGPHGYGTVRDSAMEGAIAVVEWFANEWRRLTWREKHPEPSDELTPGLRRLAGWIEKRGGSTSARDVQRSLRAFSKSDAAQAALDALGSAGLGSWHAPENGVGGLVFALSRQQPADTWAVQRARDRVGVGASADTAGEGECSPCGLPEDNRCACATKRLHSHHPTGVSEDG